MGKTIGRSGLETWLDIKKSSSVRKALFLFLFSYLKRNEQKKIHIFISGFVCDGVPAPSISALRECLTLDPCLEGLRGAFCYTTTTTTKEWRVSWRWPPEGSSCLTLRWGALLNSSRADFLTLKKYIPPLQRHARPVLHHHRHLLNTLVT